MERLYLLLALAALSTTPSLYSMDGSLHEVKFSTYEEPSRGATLNRVSPSGIPSPVSFNRNTTESSDLLPERTLWQIQEEPDEEKKATLMNSIYKNFHHRMPGTLVLDRPFQPSKFGVGDLASCIEDPACPLIKQNEQQLKRTMRELRNKIGVFDSVIPLLKAPASALTPEQKEVLKEKLAIFQKNLTLLVHEKLREAMEEDSYQQLANNRDVWAWLWAADIANEVQQLLNPGTTPLYELPHSQMERAAVEDLLKDQIAKELKKTPAYRVMKRYPAKSLPSIDNDNDTE